MKKISKIIFIVLSSTAFLFSCEEPRIQSPSTGTEVGSVTLILPDGTKYSGASTGNPQDTIFVEIEGSINIDLQRISMYASIPNNAIIDPPLKGMYDFNQPVNFTVIGADGARATYTVKAVLVPTAIEVTELWTKPAKDFNFKDHDHAGIGISGDYIVLHTRTAFYYHNISDGSYVGTMSWEGCDLSPNCFHLTSDDVGHIVSCNYVANAGGELRIYSWENVTANPKLLLSWVSDCPNNLGRKIYVKGDLNKLAYIYVTVSFNSTVLRWEVKNGEVTSSVPEKINFTNPNPTWTYLGKMVPIEVSKTSNYFINCAPGDFHITYMNGTNNTCLYNSPNIKWLGSAHAFDYVDLHGAKYLFLMETNPYNACCEIFKVRALIKDPASITDVNLLVHTRNQADYWPYDSNFATNGNSTGDVKALIAPDGKSAIVAFLATNTGVKVWKIELL